MSFAGSSGLGTPVAAVSGSGADYNGDRHRDDRAQTVVVHPGRGRGRFAGNTSSASTGTDNTVTYNDIGTPNSATSRFDTQEDGGMATVTTLAEQRLNGPISVNLHDRRRHPPRRPDYTLDDRHLDWADGDTTPGRSRCRSPTTR